MSERKEDPLVAVGEDGIELHRRVRDGGMPVLMLHGGSAHSGTFAIPGRGIDDEPRCLKDWLWEEGFEPWLLDWRASTRVIAKIAPSDPQKRLRNCFDLDNAAEIDVQWALDEICARRDDAERIGAIGHCLGAGVLAQAIASGYVAGRKPALTNVVLMTLGLHYIPGSFWDKLKAKSNPLEDVWARNPELVSIDPGATKDEPWPDELEAIYQGRIPPHSQLPHDINNESGVNERCNRLSFMYGRPYDEEKLAYEIHHDTWTVAFEEGKGRPQTGWIIEGTRSGARGALLEKGLAKGHWGMENAEGTLSLKNLGRAGEAFQPGELLKILRDAAGRPRHLGRCKQAVFQSAELPRQFGAIPLRMYLQAVRNIVRGASGKSEGLAGEFNDPQDGVGLVRPEALAHFRDITTTLMTGQYNGLWRSDGVYKTYERLRRGRRHGDVPDPVVITGYAHQDLLWGRKAREQVFPKIKEALER
jgi:hypothetical protein